MAAELKVNDASTWRTITELKVNDAGTWRTIQDVKVNDGGTWRTVYSGTVINITDQTITDTGPSPGAAATYIVGNDGKIYRSRLSVSSGTPEFLENWITPQSNMSDYTVRFAASGDTPNIGDALNTDHNCGTSRSCGISRAFTGTVAATLTVTIKRVSDGATMDTATVLIGATYS